MNYLKDIFNNNRIITLIIFTTSLLVRLYTNNNVFVDRIPKDGVTYNNIAINLVKNGNYSVENEEPFTPYFFREPLYPLFIAGIYKIHEQINSDLEYVKTNGKYKQVKTLRIFQVILSSMSCCLLFWVFSLYFNNNISFAASILFSFYQPDAVLTTHILRETLQMFLTVLMTFFIVKHLMQNKKKHLILFSLTLGLNILTLQITILLPLFLFFYFLLNKYGLISALKKVSIIVLISSIPIIPWLYRTYNFYPDIRVVKTIGLSLTHEQRSFINSVRTSVALDIISKDEGLEIEHQEWYRISEYEKFERSYNGYFRQLKSHYDSLIANNSTWQQRLTLKAKNIISNIQNTWLQSFVVIVPQNSNSAVLNPLKIFWFNRMYIHLIIAITSVLLGILGILGTIKYLKRVPGINIVFLYYLLLFPILASEPRRLLIIHPYIILFAILFIIWFISRFFLKFSNEKINSFVIKSN